MIASCIAGLFLMLVAILLHLAFKLEETRKEIEKFRRDQFRMNRLLERRYLSVHHPELADPVSFEIETEGAREPTTSLGNILKTAKENARRNPY